MGLLDSIINCVVHNAVGKATENVEALLMKKIVYEYCGCKIVE